MATLGQLELGSIVKINEDGVAQEFYVCQHGYPTAGNGRTLLVRRRNYSNRRWHTSDINALATSDIDAWLNGAYLGMLDADIQAQIAAVSIRYTPGNGNDTVGDLSRKMFLLSMTELGQTSNFVNVEGATLSATVVDLLGIATSSTGIRAEQWTRSPRTSSTTAVCRFNTLGAQGVASATILYGARPAFTLPSSLTVSNDGTVITTQPYIPNAMQPL